MIIAAIVFTSFIAGFFTCAALASMREADRDAEIRRLIRRYDGQGS